MALHRDFLMRMIEQLSAAFFRIVAGQGTDAPEQALIDIEDLLAGALGSSRDFALGLGPAAIDTVEPPLAAELARLLLLHAQLSEELGQGDRAQRARRMGFRAIERALERPGTEFARLAAAQLREHIDSLAPRVGAEPLGRACLGAHQTAVEVRQWSDAEDWLFFALESAATPQSLATGHAFYQRLLAMSDVELAAGGLSRDEVVESSLELARY